MSRKITSERNARNRRWGFGQEYADAGSGLSSDKPAETEDQPQESNPVFHATDEADRCNT